MRPPNQRSNLEKSAEYKQIKNTPLTPSPTHHKLLQFHKLTHWQILYPTAFSVVLAELFGTILKTIKTPQLLISHPPSQKLFYILPE
jgi:hypothetical protein